MKSVELWKFVSQIGWYFFTVDINLKHNVILYFFDLFSCINIENENFFVDEDFVCVNFVLVVYVFSGLVLKKKKFFSYYPWFFFSLKKIVNYIIYPNNILFNREKSIF